MTHSSSEGGSDPRRHRAMWVLLAASVMNLLDITIVNVALPRMEVDLGATSNQLEWVSAIYILAFAAGLLPFGRFGDILGRKRIFLWGIGGFTAASVLCGIAPGIGTLIAARMVQGLAAAMMIPQTLAIIQVLFSDAERPKAFARFASVTSVAAVCGPIIGGALISFDIGGLDWRPIFLVNLPFGLLAIWAGIRWITPIAPDPDMRADPVGVLLFASASLLVVFPLVEGRAFGWPWWCFVLILAGGLAAAAFVAWEASRAAAGRAELLPASLLRNPMFMAGIVTVMLFASVPPGFFMMLALFFQSGFDLTPLQSGLTTVTFPLGIMATSTLSGRINGRFPEGRMVLGAVLLLIGMTWVKIAVGNVGETLDPVQFLAPLGVCGLGMGFVIVTLFQIVLGHVPRRDAGAGSGSLQAFQQVGGALGIAVTGQIFFSTLSHGGGLGTAGPEAWTRAVGAGIWYPLLAYVGILLISLLALRQSGKRSAVSSQ